MAKIIFVPSNETQTRMFIPIFYILNCTTRNEITVICIDSYKFENSRKILIAEKIPYRNIEKYGTANVAEILKQEHADLIIIGNDSAPIEKSFVIAGNNLGIPTLLIQDGLITEALVSVQAPARIVRKMKDSLKFTKPYRFLLETLLNLNKPVRTGLIVLNIVGQMAYSNSYGFSGCTNIAVTGNYVKKMLIQRGVPPERITVTGQPRYDKLFAHKIDKQEFFSKIGLSSDKKIVTLCTQPFVEYNIWTKEKRKIFLFSVISALEKLLNVQLIIKLHPIEEIHDYQEILSSMKLNRKTISQPFLCKNLDLQGLIDSSDILVTVSSTVALEAMFLDKPIVIVDLFNECGRLSYVVSGAAVVASNSDDFVVKIRSLLNNQKNNPKIERNVKRFVYEHAYQIDGKASQRVVDLITQIIEEEDTKVCKS